MNLKCQIRNYPEVQWAYIRHSFAKHWLVSCNGGSKLASLCPGQPKLRHGCTTANLQLSLRFTESNRFEVWTSSKWGSGWIEAKASWMTIGVVTGQVQKNMLWMFKTSAFDLLKFCDSISSIAWNQARSTGSDLKSVGLSHRHSHWVEAIQSVVKNSKRNFKNWICSNSGRNSLSSVMLFISTKGATIFEPKKS